MSPTPLHPIDRIDLVAAPLASAHSVLRRTRGAEQQEVKRQVAHFAAIVASSSDAIIGKDVNGIITSWNPAACAMFGYEDHEMIGQPLLKLIPHDRRSEEPLILAKIRAGESVKHFETVRQRKSGAEIHVSVNISPIKDAQGRIIGACKIVRDISERIQAERAQADARDELNLVNRERDLFLASMSHELRTPLNAVVGFAQLMRAETTLTANARDCLDEIESAGQKLMQLIGSIFDMVGTQSHGLTLPTEPAQVGSILRQGLQQMESQARTSGITLQWHPGTGDDVYLCVDDTRVRRALGVMLSNAIKITQPGGQVRVTSQVTPQHVRLLVTDTGQGIATDGRDTLFAGLDVLRTHAVNLRQVEMSLAISQRVVQAMGGTIGYTSTPNQGSTCWIELPLRGKPA